MGFVTTRIHISSGECGHYGGFVVEDLQIQSHPHQVTSLIKTHLAFSNIG